MTPIDLTIVVPLLNEEQNVQLLYDAITAAMSAESLEYSYEILFVDDGSTDKTFEMSANLAASDQRLKVIRFRKNFGQTPAMAAGIDFASGKTIVTMDGDLQNDPKDIGQLVRALDGGADIAVGWRFRRQDKLISRKIPSRIANWLIGKVTGVPIRDNGCSLKAYRSALIKRVPLYSEMHRFIPAMSTIAGARIVQLKVRHHARRFGESKYGLSRVYKVLLDLLTIKTLTAFASKPLYWFAALSAPFLVTMVVASVWASLTLIVAPNDTIVLQSGVVLLSGGAVAFLMICGFLGELVFRTARLDVTKLAILSATPLQPLKPGSEGSQE